ncbi:MAG: DUF393 domain-containing protein [Bacteroidetes bacterium]|nr:DUF393 domain-containing protein [Bacteroidota bacterium]
MDISKQRIVFFDGYCNLCNFSVNVCVRYNSKGKLKFASLQSETAKRLLNIELRKPGEPDSIVFWDHGRVFTESDAVMRLSRYLVFPISVFGSFLWIPKSFRDAVYRWIARNRYRWFGKKSTCRLPSEKERTMFLD